MKKRNNCRLLIILAALSLTWGTISAQMNSNRQEAFKPPQSPWTVGAQVGLSVVKDCWTCKDGNDSQMLSAGLDLNYRSARWIALTGEVSWARQDFYYYKFMYNNNDGTSLPLQGHARMNWAGISFGPQLLLRLGQGDLHLDYLFGVAVRTANVEAVTATGNSYLIEYKPSIQRLNILRVGYTYWPKPKFGITLGVELRSVAYLYSDGYLQPKADLGAEYPEFSDGNWIGAAPNEDGQTVINALVGIRYRLN